jgi:hypothetical protein
MMLNAKKFSPLINNLTTAFSKSELHEDKPKIFSLSAIFHEDNKPCFKITCSPITETNFSMCEFVFNSVMHVAQDIYKNGLRDDEKYIIATSGFCDACKRVIERYQSDLDKNHLDMKYIDL